MSKWTQTRPPERPLWVILQRSYSLKGKEHISCQYHTTTEDREEAEETLVKLREMFPHAIFELAEC